MTLEEELKMMEDHNRVYYKIILGRDGKHRVICLQWFDEHDYDQDRFLTDAEGEQLKFSEEMDAKRFLNRVIKPEYIDEDDRIPDASAMLRLPKEDW